eukprot:NODE_161_length_14984_cov_0.487000.p1 type:complete len:823 gc:universal NODE_161_length_14984_cov_0.487000:6363-8831(+)
MDSKEKKDEKPKVPFQLTDVFKRYGTTKEYFLMFIGFLGAIGFGASLPLQTLFFGDAINAFNSYDYVMNHPFNDAVRDAARDKVEEQVLKVIISFLILGAAVFVCAYLLQSLWCYTGAQQSRRLRLKFFNAMLYQPVAWHDEHKAGELNTHLTTSMSLIQEGVSERFVMVFNYLASFIAGFVIAFSKSWKMTLVLLSVFPLLVITSAIFAKIISESANSTQSDYAQAGAVAQEVLSNIRTVTSYNAQEHFIKKFNVFIDKSYIVGRLKGFKTGLAMGVTFMLMFGDYGLGFWYGSTLVVAGEIDGGTVLNVFFAVLIGAFVLGNLSPSLGSIFGGNGAWHFIKQVVDTSPPLVEGKKPEKLQGLIEFKDIEFTYPTRKETQVLKKFTLTVEPGQKVALVGASGSGKSTIVQLLQKFYKPDAGTITVDGQDLQDLDTKWWRTNVGLVSQEPILFDATIAENIILGCKEFDPATPQENIEKSCQLALAHDFIMKFPDKYQTWVGEKGSLMSGGQKQRIAIARALIKDPSILLLDEATSALDSSSEKIVQEALDKAADNRTTIVIAHRLSTIRDADKIVVMKSGQIIEQGTYESLVAQQGEFYSLVKAQELAGNKEEMKQAKTEAKEENVVVQQEAEKVKTLPITKWPLARLFKMQKPELPIMILGAFGAAVNGAIFPVFNLFFGNILGVFAKDKSEIQEGANLYAILFAVLGFVALIANTVQITCFTISGEKLTCRIRENLFRAYLRQDIGYFDDPNHTSGALSANIAEEAERIKGLTGELLGIICQFLATVIFGLGIAFYYNPALAGLILVVMPFTALQGHFI